MPRMRICLWHGWLLEGTGSNVHTAKVADAMRRAGHDVLVVCQERHPERLGFVDAHGTVARDGVSILEPLDVEPSSGRCVVLRPDIGRVLPVFVYDEYEGFEVKRFVDLTDAELGAYLRSNAEALRAAVAWHGSDVTIAGHGIPGPAVARAALGDGRYAAKIHGSDLEYAIRPDARYRSLAREGLSGAVAVSASSDDALMRMAEVVPVVAERGRVVPPGVDVGRFRPRPRREALSDVAERLEVDPDTVRGRPDALDVRVEAALEARDADALEALAGSYDQTVPDPGAAGRLRVLAGFEGPIVGSFGKLILPKGVERVLEAVAVLPEARGVVVGFGLFREWLHALAAALDRGDAEAARWLRERGAMRLELSPEEVSGAAGSGARFVFTGKLDHRYAPEVLAATDVLVVPSTLPEAFGMVAAEGAAAGALPLVARHSGLAEVAATLEAAAGRPGLFSFEPGDGATRRLAGALRGLIALPAEEREELRAAARAVVEREWAWDRTAARLLEAATGR